MVYTTIKNTPLLIDPEVAAIDQGWSIREQTAYHEGCFAGVIEADGIHVEPGKTYTVEFEVKDYSSGGVNAVIAGINGTNRTAKGTYVEEFTIPENAEDTSIKFYSDGTLGIGSLVIYPSTEADNGVTLGFNSDENRWTSDYPFCPEMMLRFTNSLFAFKHGRLWKQNANEVRNNFFGVQYNSSIIFVINVDYMKDKLWFNLRLDSKGKWYAPKITTPKTDQFPNGMETRLKKGNFKLIDGKLWADILRDINDPKFQSITDIDQRKVQALFKGRMMQGGYLIIELQCDDTTEAKLASAEVYYTEIERSF